MVNASAAFLFFAASLGDYSPVRHDLTGMGIFFTCLFLVIIIANLIGASRAKSGKSLKSVFLRGAELITKDKYIRSFDKRGGMKSRISLGGIPIPVPEETKGFFFTGKPGTGKTLSFYNILYNIKEKTGPSKKIIYDFKGDYVSKFYDLNSDMIFNPLDRRSVKWDIFSEFSGSETARQIMAERIASSVIPDSRGKTGNNEKFWRDGAREVLTALLNCIRLENRGSNRALFEMLSLSASQISSKIGGYEICANASNFLTPPDSPQAGGIMATLTQYTRFVRYLDKTGSGGFSITGWLSDGKDGTIFAVNKSDMQDVLKPVLTLFLDLLGGGILALPDEPDRRIFLMIDEIGTLHEVESLVNILTLGRSKGVSAWLAVQDFSQLDHIYGEDLRKTIINACTSHVYFSVADNSTAETISRLIGEQEAVEKSSTLVSGGGRSETMHKQRKAALMPSEIMRLMPFEFIFNGNFSQPFKSRLDPGAFSLYPDRTDSFLIRLE